MKIELYIPPLGSLTHPYLSLPALTAFLRKFGHEAGQLDIGIRALDKMLTRNFIEKSAVRIDAVIKSTANAKEPISFEQKKLLQSAQLFAEDIASNIEAAKSILKNRESFYEPAKYSYAANTIRRALEIISAGYFPTRIDFDNIYYGVCTTFDNIYKIACDESRNPFLEIIRDEILPVELSQDVSIVGISATFYSQLFGAYTIARLVKEFSPNTHVVIGGAAVTSAEKRIRADRESFRWVDSYIFGEGESAFLKLIEIVESGGSIKNDFKKLYMKIDYSLDKNTDLAYFNVEEREDFENLPTPDYSGLNLEDYLSPETVFLISNSRGCYWGKCNFCSHSLAFKNICRQRPLEKLKNDIRTIHKKHAARFFYFGDDCIPPKRCGEIAKLSPELNFPFIWQAEIRYEKSLSKELIESMHDGGCRMLIFGNESGNQRVLDLMNKHTEVERNIEIVKNTYSAGIAVHLQNFIGFPGEEIDEAAQTIDFLVSLKDFVNSFSLATFVLTEYSPVHLEPQKFGLKNIAARNPDELIPVFSFEVENGASPDEISEYYKSAKRILENHFSLRHDFLDSHIGAHALLYYHRFGNIKKENIFGKPRDIKINLDSKVTINLNILRKSIDGDALLLYNPETADIAYLDKTLSHLYHSFADKIVLKQCAVKLRNALKVNRPIEDFIAFVIFAAMELHEAGFIEFE